MIDGHYHPNCVGAHLISEAKQGRVCLAMGWEKAQVTRPIVISETVRNVSIHILNQIFTIEMLICIDCRRKLFLNT